MSPVPAAVATAFRFFRASVIGVAPLGPSLVRVTFGGPELAEVASGGLDQSVSLFLPHPGQSEPVVPVEAGHDWWQAWRALPEAERAVMRTYTLRAQRVRPDGTTEVDVDFALHGAGGSGGAGPAARWAAGAVPGDRALLYGPAVADNRAVKFRPPHGTDLVVVWADETALPAAGAILESLPSGMRGVAWLEVRHEDDRQALATHAEVTWLVTGRGAPSGPAAIRAAEFPAARAPYVWIAGEAGTVKELRRHLVGERGLDRRAVTFTGYWRRGMSEDRMRAEGAGAE
ncbi:siderophore-interacting protein [Streptomyces sp. NPDC049906]|uniref:siderophore-interacting protein n=1 Tax=Streptomyces sp. NPDC049906 TaxID=3155656 RepID=UPI003435085F